MENSNLHDLKGERKNQILVLVDRAGKPLGLASRQQCHSGTGRPHLAFMALIRDNKGDIILTKRSKGKSLWGGFWDGSVVSHVLPGETPEKAAQRRGREEMGVDVKFTDIGAFYYFAKFQDGAENEFCHVLLGKSDKEMQPNPVEIEDTKKILPADLRKDIQKNPDSYTPWLKLAFEKIDFKTL